MILKIYKGMGTALALLLVASACGDTGETGDARPLVVATTSIWGDLVSRVVGDNATVEVLIPSGADPHDFQPSSRQVSRLREASLVVANGLDLEEGLTNVLEVAADDGVQVVFLGDAIATRPLTDSDRPDPHFWTDPQLVTDALASLVGSLSTAIELPATTWEQAATSLEADLERLDATLASLAAALPDDRRLIVTTHDSLGYFAAAYGYEVVGVAVPGGSTLASPSAADLSTLVDAIAERGVSAVFVDAGQFANLAESLASSSRVAVVPVNIASLGDPGSGTDSYFGMMETLGETVQEALS